MAAEQFTAPGPPSQRSWVPLALAAVMLLVAAAVLYQGRGTLPFYDEWNFIIERRGHSLSTLLQPHNGHLVLAPLLLYKLLLQLAGLDHYWVFRLALVALHLLVGLGVFVLARRRVGELGALVAASLVLVCFAAADDLLWAFQISFLLAVAFGVWMLVGLDRESVRGDLLACLCLAGTLVSAAIGLPFAVAAIVIIGLDGRRLQRAWVVVLPLLLFALWYLGYGVSELNPANAPAAPRYAAEMASNAAGGLVGFGVEYGRPLVLALVAVLALRFAKPRSVSPWLVAVVGTAVALWALTALARADIGEPLAPRYIYPGAVLIVLIVVELLRGRRLAPAALPVAMLLVAVAALANYSTLGAFAAGLRANADVLSGRLGALAVVGAALDPDFQPVPREDPVITVRGAAEAQRDFGSIAVAAAALPTASEPRRQAADALLLAAGQLKLAAAPAVTGRAPQLLALSGARSQAADSCRRLLPVAAAATSVDVALPPGSSLVVASADAVPLYVRRFAGSFPAEPSFTAVAGTPTRITAAADRSAVRWVVEAKPTAPLTVCAR